MAEVWPRLVGFAAEMLGGLPRKDQRAVGAENLCHLGRCPEERRSVPSRVRRSAGRPGRGGMIFGLWA